MPGALRPLRLGRAARSCKPELPLKRRTVSRAFRPSARRASLRSVRVEFYDRFDAETNAAQVDPREVTRCQVAFTIAVMDRAFRRTSGWALLEVVPLSEKEQAEVYRSFKQYPGGALSIYGRNPTAPTSKTTQPGPHARASNARRSGIPSMSRTDCATIALVDRTNGSSQSH